MGLSQQSCRGTGEFYSLMLSMLTRKAPRHQYKENSNSWKHLDLVPSTITTSVGGPNSQSAQDLLRPEFEGRPWGQQKSHTSPEPAVRGEMAHPEAQILSTSSFPLSDASMSHSRTDLTVAIHTGFYEHFHFLFSIHTSQSLRTHRSLGTSASGSSIVAAGCPSSLGACQTICEFHLWWYHFFPIYMIQIFCKIQ